MPSAWCFASSARRDAIGSPSPASSLLLSWVKIPFAPAVLAVAAYRLINLWLPMLPALAGLPALRRLERRPRPHAGPA